MARIDHAGKRFGRLVAVRVHTPGKSGVPSRWVMRCDCGSETTRLLGKKLGPASACYECYSGSKARNWKGVGELPATLVREIYHGAVARGLAFSIDADYLWAVYQGQRGRCAFTGWAIPFRPRTASLDRIDSTLGYLPG